jgi:hypothetical protein
MKLAAYLSLVVALGLNMTSPANAAEQLPVCDDSTPYKIDHEPVCKTAPGFFNLYQQNREAGIGNYLTDDFWLQAYSMTRQAALSDFEQKKLMPQLKSVIDQLAQRLTKTDQEPATEANRDFLAVLQKLTGSPSVKLSKLAQQEFDLVEAADGIVVSPLWQIPIDYSQFKPRGRYTRNEEAQHYFRSYRYAASVLFPFQASGATGVKESLADRLILQAKQLTQILKDLPETKTLEASLDWQMGPADDLTSAEFAAATQAMAKDASPAQWRKTLFDYAKQNGKQPRIMAGSLDTSKLAPNQSAQDAMTGWRLLPLRYSADSAAFQQLVFDKTGPYLGDCKDCPRPQIGLGIINGRSVKVFPSAKEIAAALGSTAAEDWIKSHREDQFENYAAARTEVGKILEKAQGLNGEQLRLMQDWLTDAPADFAARNLGSMLGFWTWQRYVNVLYAKQSYTLQSKSLRLEKSRDSAWLTPATRLYRRLLTLSRQTAEQDGSPLWKQFIPWLERTVAISEKIDAGQTLSKEDIAFLNNVDRPLKSLVGEDGPIVVDVHTNPASGEVLEEALGYVKMVKHGENIGGRWWHTEFKQPMNDRLTDETWQQRLSESHP